MPKKINSEHRLGIFIDIQNLYHSAKNLYGSRVSYPELLKAIVGDRKTIRILGYVVRSQDQTEEENAFFEALEKSGIELREKEIQVYSSGAKKADWDVGLAVDTIRLASSLDVIILVTGDGDFIPLVEYLQVGMGKIVEVAAFPRTCSGKLRDTADRFIDLEENSRIIFRTTRSQKTKRIKNK